MQKIHGEGLTFIFNFTSSQPRIQNRWAVKQNALQLLASWPFPFLVNNEVILKYTDDWNYGFGHLEGSSYDCNSICRSMCMCSVWVHCSRQFAVASPCSPQGLGRRSNPWLGYSRQSLFQQQQPLLWFVVFTSWPCQRGLWKCVWLEETESVCVMILYSVAVVIIVLILVIVKFKNSQSREFINGDERGWEPKENFRRT